MWEFNIALPLLTLDELQKIKRENPRTILLSVVGRLCYAYRASEDTRFGFTGFAVPNWHE